MCGPVRARQRDKTESGISVAAPAYGNIRAQYGTKSGEQALRCLRVFVVAIERGKAVIAATQPDAAGARMRDRVRPYIPTVALSEPWCCELWRGEKDRVR